MYVRTALMGATALSPGIVLMAAPSIEDLQAEITALQEEAAGLVTAADEAGEDLTDDQVERIDAIDTEIQAKTKQITARQKAARVVPSAGRKSTPEPTNGGGDRTVPAAPRTVNPRGGFESLGRFAMAVQLGSRQGAQPDNRLVNAATTYGSEGVGADGGFLVPPEFSRQIWEKVMGEDNLANRCAQLQTGSNNLRIPKDETTPWQTTGGIQVSFEGEAGAIAPSKPAFEFTDMRLVKLTALVPVSDELLEDAVGIESWLRAKAPTKMAAKINTAIVRGNGVGQPLGILDAGNGGLITVDPNISQPADTVWFENISDMYARMYAPWRRNSVWLINQDIESQLDQMAFDPQATSKVPVYLPAGGLSASPYATLKGRPVVPVEACSTLGDVGDIILVDLQQYWFLTKASGMRTDTSIHLYFDQALTTFRFIFRMNGQPAWSSTIAPQHGSLTRSWAVTLGART